MKIYGENANMKYHDAGDKCKLTGDYCHYGVQNIGGMDCRQCNVPIIMAIEKLARQEVKE